ncbi:MAG: phosphoglycerate dehydrogenase [Deltaproteobacteria bacterium]|nr:phosphoglycerate dehydrogenase [Deltaproteobacteria bacterium]
MSYRILVSDNVHQRGIDLLESRQGFQVEVRKGLAPDELKRAIVEYHALIIRSATKVTPDILAAARNLRVIGRAGTGLDNVDIREATKRGIVVMNTPGGNSVAAAEHTIALIMAAHRHIPQADRSMKTGKWEKKQFQGREMAGRTLGVIGLGKIGTLVSKAASRGLKMRVLGYDPVTTSDVALQCGATLTSVEEVFRRSDIITVHTPLNDETRNIVDSRAFSLMKDGVIIINCARGGIIDEQALLENLESGKVAVAALDVFSVSPPGQHPLVMHPRVIATPHLGASTDEAQINVAVAIAQQVIDYLESGVVRNAVNVPGMDPAMAAKMGPYLELAKRLAQFLGGLAPAGVIEMEMEYQGEIAAWDVQPITNAALVGLLQSFEGMDVNEVNAPLIAQERGIRVLSTTMSEGSQYGPSVVIRIRRLDGTRVSVQGALIRRIGDEPRIIAIDRFITEAVPAGPMLIVTNKDIPGMIAGISGALARGGINIAQMNLSRDCPGGMAMSIWNVDTSVDEETLAAIRSVPGILSVKQVILDA